ncbi:MAG: hypothetical protein P4M15_11635 [Alphaproteobacteria bacterium]|nr:hypothetical protein [Alphaproteobacteria bacterium]
MDKTFKNRLLLTCALLGMGMPLASNASPPVSNTYSATSTTEVRPYAGLSWTFGEGYAPSLVAGVATAVVHSDGQTQGADVAATFGFVDGFSFKKVSVNYLYGNSQVQGEAGGGYSFAKDSFLADAGVNVDYFNFSADNYLDESFVPQITIRSLGAFTKPAENVVAPSPG